MNEANTKVPCRKSQVELLSSIFGQGLNFVYPSLFLYGHSGTGKSLVLQTLVEEKKLAHAMVNCVECYTQKLIYETILNQVSGVKPTPQNDFTPYSRCDNMNDFVRLLQQIMKESHSAQTVYIIFDKAERLRDMNINLLPAFLRLHELTGLNVCSILVSEIVWEKFTAGTGSFTPFIIHFPDYTKDELVEILRQDCPDGCSESLYANYVPLVLSVFHLACRSLTELRHLARLNFPKYMEPVTKGECDENNTARLWRNIEPHLRKALHTVYLREVSSAQWERMQQEAQESSVGTPIQLHGMSSGAQMELPFYSKYLLLAAYLASYNPAKSDKRFFAKASSKTTKRSNLATIKKHERTSNQLLGPKQFPLDRLMAIFYAILDGKAAPTANIFSQISSLVSLGLMVQIASSDQLDTPKYKCLVSLDLAKAVARSVQFDIIRHLYDFV